MARLRHKIWLYLLLMVFVFGLTAQASGEDPPGVKTKFKDVGLTDSNAVYINYVSQRGIINGFPDGSYHPTEGLTRAQAATVMVKAGGLQTGDTANLFKDVASTYWAAGYISSASKAGYISGFPDGTFRPEEKLTRAQAMSMLMRLCTVKTADQLPVLEDMERNHWAASAMASALAADMIGTSSDGKKGYPDSELSRAGLARAVAVLLTKDPGLYKTPLYGTITDVVGSVSITSNGITKELKPDTRLSQGDTLITGKKSSARINYPDGSSTLMEADSELFVKASEGRTYIKKDGSPGTAVDFLNVDLKKGTLFGALATKHEITDGDKEQAAQATRLAALPSFKLAANTQAAPWYKTAETKKVKVKVDMPWGVAAVRGTFIRATVYPDGTCKVSCLTGNASMQGNTGSSVALGEGQTSSVSGDGQAAGQASSLSADDKAAFEQVQTWVLETALNMDMNQAATETQAFMDVTVEVSSQADKATAIQAVIDAFASTGITLDSQTIQNIQQQLENMDSDIEIDTGQGGKQSNNNAGNTGSRDSRDTGTTYVTVNYSTAGTYGPAEAASSTTISGSVNILVAGVTLQNMVITGDLTLAAGIGDGDVTLNNVTVQGATYVYGGGSASVHLNSCSLVNVVVDRENNVVRLVASGTTSVGSLVLNSGATLEESGLNGTAAGFSSVSTGIELPSGLPIILCGNFDAVSITVPGLAIQVTGGSVAQLSIGKNAAGTSLTLNAGSSVGTLSVNATANVGGTGTISSATISVTGVTMAQTPASLEVAPGVSASVGGQQVIGTSTNHAPSTPIISMTPGAASGITTATVVTITAASTDSDGDTVTYVWGGRLAETSTYPTGEQVVTVSAVDEHGASSEAAAVVFVVTSGQGSQATGGMTLTGPESRIYGNGIAGGNVTGYTFNVPAVSGHSGQDHGWVRGLNISTQQWETLDMGNTSNGISFSRTIDSGKLYSRLEFYYFTNHDCMYNKSNITYTAEFAFGNIAPATPAEAAPVANNIVIVGNGTTLIGCYDYNDANGDLEGKSTYQWYCSNEQSGANKQVINGATNRTYSVAAGDTNYYFFEVNPVGSSGVSGTITGVPVISIGRTPLEANQQLASEIAAVGSSSDAKALFKAMNRLGLDELNDIFKDNYWTRRQTNPDMTTLYKIQANIVDAVNLAQCTASSWPIINNITINAAQPAAGETSVQVYIMATDQQWGLYGSNPQIEVTVTGGTAKIASGSGTVVAGSLGSQNVTFTTGSWGDMSVIVTLDNPADQTVIVNARKRELSAAPVSIVFSQPAKTVSVGGQNGTILATTAGQSASFVVTTENIVDDTQGQITWCTSDGSTAAATPSGVSTSISTVTNNSSAITVNADDSATLGTYYFKVSIDGATSNVATLSIVSQ